MKAWVHTKKSLQSANLPLNSRVIGIFFTPPVLHISRRGCLCPRFSNGVDSLVEHPAGIFLVERGPNDVNAVDVNAVDGEGQTALHYAAMNGHASQKRPKASQSAPPPPLIAPFGMFVLDSFHATRIHLRFCVILVPKSTSPSVSF